MHGSTPDDDRLHLRAVSFKLSNDSPFLDMSAIPTTAPRRLFRQLMAELSIDLRELPDTMVTAFNERKFNDLRQVWVNLAVSTQSVRVFDILYEAMIRQAYPYASEIIVDLYRVTGRTANNLPVMSEIGTACLIPARLAVPQFTPEHVFPFLFQPLAIRPVDEDED